MGPKAAPKEARRGRLNGRGAWRQRHKTWPKARAQQPFPLRALLALATAHGELEQSDLSDIFEALSVIKADLESSKVKSTLADAMSPRRIMPTRQSIIETFNARSVSGVHLPILVLLALFSSMWNSSAAVSTTFLSSS